MKIWLVCLICHQSLLSGASGGESYHVEYEADTTDEEALDQRLEKRDLSGWRREPSYESDYDYYYDPGRYNPQPVADRRNDWLEVDVDRNHQGSYHGRMTNALMFFLPALLGLGGLLGLGASAFFLKNDNDTNNIINFNPNITYRGDNITFTVTDTDTITNTNSQTQTANANNAITNTDNNVVNTGVNPINANAGGGVVINGPINSTGKKKRSILDDPGLIFRKLIEEARKGRLQKRAALWSWKEDIFSKRVGEKSRRKRKRNRRRRRRKNSNRPRIEKATSMKISSSLWDEDYTYDPGYYQPNPPKQEIDRQGFFLGGTGLGLGAGAVFGLFPVLLSLGGILGAGLGAIIFNNNGNSGNDNNVITFNPNITYEGDNINSTVTDTDTITNGNTQTQTATATNTINNMDTNTVNTAVNPINANADNGVRIEGPITANNRRSFGGKQWVSYNEAPGFILRKMVAVAKANLNSGRRPKYKHSVPNT